MTKFTLTIELEADNWVKLAIQECFLSSSGISNGEPDILKPGIQKELQEQFRVYLVPSAKFDPLYGECLLQCTLENIYLWDINNSKLKLCAWPLTALRRYGTVFPIFGNNLNKLILYFFLFRFRHDQIYI